MESDGMCTLEGGPTESCVFVEYGEKFDPLIEWCTARELSADGLVWDQIIGRIWAPCYINVGLYVW